MTSAATRIFLVGCLFVIGKPALAQGSPSPGGKAAESKSSRRSAPKCRFLGEEYLRVQKEAQEFVSASRFADSHSISEVAGLGASVDEFAEYIATSEEYSARLTILRMNREACERGVSLSAKERLPSIDVVRQRHLVRARRSWTSKGGTEQDAQLELIIKQINVVYDNEARSFYNSESIRGNLEPDIVKDYPTILEVIRESSLPPQDKAFFEANSQFMKYEEAGKLFNILKGLDPMGSLSYAYTLRKVLEDRAQQSQSRAHAEAAKVAEESVPAREGIMTWIWVGGFMLLLAVIGAVVFANSERYAKFKAIRSGELRMPYWWGMKELILWEPGEAVILLRNKRLVAMTDATGGYTSISAWSGEEYKGRITYKTQMMNYTSDPIHTSDGVQVRLEMVILWQIQNPNTYVSRISPDYHEHDSHEGEPRSYTDSPKGEKYFDKKLTETAEKWIRLLAGSTLREHICQLTAARLISPYVQSYIHHYFQLPAEPSQKYESRMPTILGQAQDALNKKTLEYGIRIEKLETKELKLPRNLEERLETVRLSFLQPAQALASAEAGKIERGALNQTQLEALRGLADIIGADNVARIEFMKAIGLAKIPFVAPYAPPFSAVFSSTQQVLPTPDQPPEHEGPSDQILDVGEKVADQEPEPNEPKSKAANAGKF